MPLNKTLSVADPAVPGGVLQEMLVGATLQREREKIRVDINISIPRIEKK
jgi:hypothetical protein